MSIESVMPSNHLIICHPLLLLASTVPSVRVFSNESLHISGKSIRVSASALVLPMNIQDLFPLGWTGFDLLAVEGTLKSPLQPQFKSINSLVLGFPYSPTLTSIYDQYINIGSMTNSDV